METYRLVGKIAVPETDLLKWGRWLDKADRRVARDVVGGVLVSTVFLGMDHGWGEGPPILFETMAFEDEDTAREIETFRYSTWDEAEKGHAELVRKYREIAEAATLRTEPSRRE